MGNIINNGYLYFTSPRFNDDTVSLQSFAFLCSANIVMIYKMVTVGINYTERKIIFHSKENLDKMLMKLCLHFLCACRIETDFISTVTGIIQVYMLYISILNVAYLVNFWLIVYLHAATY